MRRIVRFSLIAGALAFVACGQNPQQSEHARGLISGTNVVLAMTVILIVVSVVFVVGALALDRMLKARRALAEAPATLPTEDDEPEVVAGIAVGRAPVPRWSYVASVL